MDRAELLSFYEAMLREKLQSDELYITNMESLLQILEKSIAEVRDREETTPYMEVKRRSREVRSILESRRKNLAHELEERVNVLAPISTNLMGYRILSKMISRMGSLKALAFSPAGRLQIMGAERDFFSDRGPKHGFIFQHPSVKGSDERGKVARKLACRLAIALRKDYFSTHEGSPKEIDLPRFRTGFRSKLFDLFDMDKGLRDLFKGNVLYLGAGSGTTAKKLSVISGKIYCVEFAPLPFSSLLALAKKRNNIFPIMEDATHPERYPDMAVDFLYQDVSQRDQIGIFVRNMNFFGLKKGIVMVKASSIDSTGKAEDIFDKSVRELEGTGFCVNMVDLRMRYSKHAALIVSR